MPVPFSAYISILGFDSHNLSFVCYTDIGKSDRLFVSSAARACNSGCGKTTVIQFDGCTIASVDPVGLSGNDAVNYNVAINYLTWDCYYDVETAGIQVES